MAPPPTCKGNFWTWNIKAQTKLATRTITQDLPSHSPPTWETNYLALVGTRDLRTLWSPPFSLNQERHTQTRKTANFIYLFIYFCDENPLNSPPWKHTWWSEHFGKFSEKKTKSPHFQEGKKKSFEIATFWEEKNRCWNRRFVEDLGRFQAFFFLNMFMKGVLTLTPYPQGGRLDG